MLPPYYTAKQGYALGGKVAFLSILTAPFFIRLRIVLDPAIPYRSQPVEKTGTINETAEPDGGGVKPGRFFISVEN